MSDILKKATYAALLEFKRELRGIVPRYPFRNFLRSFYERENPDVHPPTILCIERNNCLANRMPMGRGTCGKKCRRDHKQLIETFRQILFDPNLLMNILVLKGETNTSCLFYCFMSISIHSLRTGLKPVFTRSDEDSVTTAGYKNRGLGMIGMFKFMGNKLMTVNGKQFHPKYPILILSIIRKQIGKKESGLNYGFETARMRKDHTLNLRIGNVIHHIPTFWFTFIPGMHIITQRQYDLCLAKAFMMCVSIFSRILEKKTEPVEATEPAGSEEETEPVEATGPIFDGDLLSQQTIVFLKSLYYFMFNSHIGKKKIYELFMREYLRIILGFTILSSEAKVNSALHELFGVIKLSPEDSACFLRIVSFMKNYKLYNSFFQEEVNRIIMSSGEFDSNVLFKQKLIRKMRENDVFWNMIFYLVYSHNQWAKKHSQPCLPVEVIIEIL